MKVFLQESLSYTGSFNDRLICSTSALLSRSSLRYEENDPSLKTTGQQAGAAKRVTVAVIAQVPNQVCLATTAAYSIVNTRPNPLYFQAGGSNSSIPALYSCQSN